MSVNWPQIDSVIAQMTRAEKRELLSRLERGTRDHTEPPYEPDEAIRLIREIAAMPVQSPDDGFSGRDHDKVLYGDPPA